MERRPLFVAAVAETAGGKWRADGRGTRALREHGYKLREHSYKLREHGYKLRERGFDECILLIPRIPYISSAFLPPRPSR